MYRQDYVLYLDSRTTGQQFPGCSLLLFITPPLPYSAHAIADVPLFRKHFPLERIYYHGRVVYLYHSHGDNYSLTDLTFC